MTSGRFERLHVLIAEAQRKRGLLDGRAARLTGKRDERDQQWNRLLALAGSIPDLTKVDATAWDQIPATVQQEILDHLATLIADLDDELDEEESGWLMSKLLVGTRTIVLLAVYAFAITGSVLWVIATNWKKAIQQPQIEATVQAERKRLAAEIEDLTRAQSEPGGGAQPDLRDTLESRRRELDAVTNLPEVVRKAMSDEAPDEGLALRMVVYMGMLGGCIHMVKSFVYFVGTRNLRRSWLLYYLAVPVQGAGLSLLVYLLMRVGVLAPDENGGGGIAQANLVGIYAFAGLTGMFAKVATDKLSEVFRTVFAAKESGN